MGKFETECPNCGNEQEIEVSGISELPKVVMCVKCGCRYVVRRLPIK